MWRENTIIRKINNEKKNMRTPIKDVCNVLLFAWLFYNWAFNDLDEVVQQLGFWNHLFLVVIIAVYVFRDFWPPKRE